MYNTKNRKPCINNLFFPEVVKGIERTILQQAYTLFLCETKEKADKEMGAVDMALEEVKQRMQQKNPPTAIFCCKD